MQMAHRWRLAFILSTLERMQIPILLEVGTICIDLIEEEVV